MSTRSEKILIAAALALLVSSVAIAHSDGIYNPTANSIGNFEGIDSNGAAVAPSGLPLDGITTGIKLAISTRKLRTAYAGSAIRVDHGGTQRDIGFVSNVLDTATLATECAGVTCKVVTWYDQSGAAGGPFDHTVVITNAPTIYQSGAVNAINSKPALLFSSAQFLSNTSLSANPVNTLYENAVISWTSGTGGIVGASGAGGLEWRVDGPTMSLLKAQTAGIGTSTLSLTAATGAVVEAQYNSTTGLYSFWLNRAAAGSATLAQALTATTSQIGVGSGISEPFNGSIGEVILYDLGGGIPGASQTSITLNQKAYWGTP